MIQKIVLLSVLAISLVACTEQVKEYRTSELVADFNANGVNGSEIQSAKLQCKNDQDKGKGTQTNACRTLDLLISDKCCDSFETKIALDIYSEGFAKKFKKK